MAAGAAGKGSFREVIAVSIRPDTAAAWREIVGGAYRTRHPFNPDCAARRLSILDEKRHRDVAFCMTAMPAAHAPRASPPCVTRRRNRSSAGRARPL